VTNQLPAEWKSQLAHLPDSDVSRLENLMARGATSPLNTDKEVGPFLLYLIGNSLEDVASQVGAPKDVIYLTFLKYNWLAKKEQITKNGMQEAVKAIHRDMVNSVLLATSKHLKEQVAKVLSGELPAEKCSYIPRSLHGVRQLIEMSSEVNDIVEKVDQKNGGVTIIHAQNAQVNQNTEQPKEEVIRIPREQRLAQLAAKKDQK